MDWVNQNKFRNWLIIVLSVSNLLTVSIIWMQSAKTNELPSREQDLRACESVNLMQKALNLDERQTKQYETIRGEQREQSKTYNDRIATLKTELSEMLFSDHPDTALVHSKALEIGELQSKVERIRFDHFNELLALCTPEQKAKLKPIVVDLFGRKPPKDEPSAGAPQGDRKEERGPRDDMKREAERDRPQAPRDNRSDRPSVEEKLSRLSDKLNLTQEQAQKIRTVLLTSERKDEELRGRSNPDPNEIQAEKDRNRKKEDESIMKLLNEDQKKEFARMILNRRK